MRLGFTYDLRAEYLALGYGAEETAEFDKEETIDAIASELEALGHEVERIGHIKNLTRRLAANERWELVFNICEGMSGTGRESQVPALLDAFNIPYVFSGPVALGVTLDKALTKHVVQNQGIPTAPFAVVSSAAELANVTLPYPLFVKPVGEGTGKGISSKSRVKSPPELATVALELLERFSQPVLVETYLPGREFTTGVLGHGGHAKAIGSMEVLYTGVAETSDYSYENKANYEDRVKYRALDGDVAEECARVSLAAWRALGCVDAGRVDLRMDANGQVCLIEVNPLAGLHPIHSDLPILCGLHGMGYAELIGEIVAAAMVRLGLKL